MKLSNEQIELQDVVRRFFERHVTSEYLRARIDGSIRVDPQLVTTLKELGLEEALDGDSPLCGIEELGLVAEEVGRSLLPEPLVEHLFGEFILPRLATTEERSQLAHTGNGPTAIAFTQCCDLSLDKKGKTLSGEILWAVGGENSGRVLAFANLGAERRAVVFDAHTAGVSLGSTPSLDLTVSLSRVTLKGVPALALGAETTHAVEETIEALKSCEVAGLCQRVIEMTCEYAKTREQFGRPVGSFQAVQHKLADAYAASESLRALSRFAVWAGTHSPEQRSLTSRAAILHAAEVGPRVCEVALQCHGGIGFTWEYDLHLFLRRAKAIASAFSGSESRYQELLDVVSA